ncbi:hypothetical protein HPG69_014785 [Diceros bicornis minor]|uniref:Uncharacterized protein n=1 Tax=Diceros bicornis minor TaxID=77932 RepID=A0A7J7EIK2_DICBM|nr:hypothetical protein HPG69_014785 [Diceros bicornis minor]
MPKENPINAPRADARLPVERRRTPPQEPDAGEGGGEGAWGDSRGKATRRSPRVLAPARPRKGERGARGARLRGPGSGRPPTAASLRASPRARAGGGARRPLRPARAHVTRAQEIGAAAARGGRLVQCPALTAGSPSPPPPGSLDGTFSSARLAAAASPPPRRPEEEEKTRLGRRRERGPRLPLPTSAVAPEVTPPAGSPLSPRAATSARLPPRWGSWTRSQAVS